MAEPTPPHDQPAYYARRGSRAADWWTVLHPPYTRWHLSYVVFGAAMAPERDWGALVLSVLAFFLAVGVSAHALDELQGRPLGTALTDRTLVLVAALGLAGAVALGVVGVFFWGAVNVPLAVTVPIGVLLVLGYNLELFGGRLHTDAVFALGWGGFPVAVGLVAQSPDYTVVTAAAGVAATLAGVGTSYAQRHLSTAARGLRRRTRTVIGTATANDGTVTPLDRETLLRPLEGGLRALSWAIPLVAVAALVAGS